MSRLVVDASVAAKWFFEGEHSPAARQLLSLRNELLAPRFLVLEFADVLAVRQRADAVSVDDSVAALSEMEGFIVFGPDDPLHAAALRLAISFGRSVYDSMYLALALQERCPLMTAAKRLVSALAPVTEFRDHVRLPDS